MLAVFPLSLLSDISACTWIPITFLFYYFNTGKPSIHAMITGENIHDYEMKMGLAIHMIVNCCSYDCKLAASFWRAGSYVVTSGTPIFTNEMESLMTEDDAKNHFRPLTLS
ncbi:hypothetical protein H671_1g3153 [Cricetulus griseus]|uniref:Uncharacterized protein n=1 Tax=Cricetulus griseus TaxID=10029 RepID=A0A061IHG1_CRIGR|nr:hypothetical protein H671_1g3153 [Cricetulus griseus]